MTSLPMPLFPKAEEIRSAIDTAEAKHGLRLARAFGERSAENGDGWCILQQVFSFHFMPSHPNKPFGPMSVFDGKRSMVPDDLTREQLDALQVTLNLVEDPEYRARVGDVLWLRLKDPRAARNAVNAYIEAGKRVEHPEHWTSSMERYERAIRLARQIEPNGELPKSILAHLESRVYEYDGTDPLFFTSTALKLLAEFRYGDFKKLASIAGGVAEKSRVDGSFRRCRIYYDVQATHLKLAKEPGQAEVARVEAARTFVEEAESRELQNEFIAAYKLWADAIAAFGDRPSLRKEIPVLQRRYSIAGEKLRNELHEVSTGEYDISKYVEESRAIVRDLPWDDAFFQFSLIVPLIDPAELRSVVEEEIADHPLQAMHSLNIHEASGRKVAVRPPAFTENMEQYEKALLGFMEQRAGWQRHLIVHAYIAPAMRQLAEDHEIRSDSVAELIDDSSLIPDDRRDLINEALVAGFQWNFPTALHLLIPQVEHSLRCLLDQRGVSPIVVKDDGVEEYWFLDRILDHQETTAALGTQFVFELRSLLVGRMGPNLRNLVAHGIASPDELRTEAAVYLWWIILRLFAYPTSRMQAFVERKKVANSQPSSTEAGKGSV